MTTHVLTLAVALGVAAAGVSRADEPEDGAALAAALAGLERSGETVSCLSTRRIDNINPVDDRNWLITTRGGPTYLNTVSRGCFNADSPFSYLRYRTSGTSLCRGEFVEVVDSSAGFVQGSCSLGHFEELIPIEETSPS